jgi:hypothetical protein
MLEEVIKGDDEKLVPACKGTCKNSARNLTESSQEKSRETKETFFTYVVKECTCGTCYTKFAKPTRIPWNSDGQGNFVNAQYGKVEIKNCAVQRYKGSGYIYVPLSQLSQIAKYETDAAKAKQVRTATSLTEAKVVAQQESQKVSDEANKLKIQNIQNQSQNLNGNIKLNKTERSRNAKAEEIRPYVEMSTLQEEIRDQKDYVRLEQEERRTMLEDLNAMINKPFGDGWDQMQIQQHLDTRRLLITDEMLSGFPRKLDATKPATQEYIKTIRKLAQTKYKKEINNKRSPANLKLKELYDQMNHLTGRSSQADSKKKAGTNGNGYRTK